MTDKALSLARLCSKKKRFRSVHFFDLVVAQMIPRWKTSAGQARSRLVCHVLRLSIGHRPRASPKECAVRTEDWTGGAD